MIARGGKLGGKAPRGATLGGAIIGGPEGKIPGERSQEESQGNTCKEIAFESIDGRIEIILATYKQRIAPRAAGPNPSIRQSARSMDV